MDEIIKIKTTSSSLVLFAFGEAIEELKAIRRGINDLKKAENTSSLNGTGSTTNTSRPQGSASNAVIEELKNIIVAVNDTAFKLMEDYVTYNSCLSPFLRARFGKHPTGMKEKEYQSLVVTTFIKKMVYDNSDVDYDDLDF